MNHYFCLLCGHHATNEEDLKHNCKPNNVVNFSHLEGTCTLVKPTLWARFRDWFFDNFMFIVSLTAAIIVNGMIMSHLNWSDGERLLESVCMGIILPRILKND